MQAYEAFREDFKQDMVSKPCKKSETVTPSKVLRQNELLKALSMINIIVVALFLSSCNIGDANIEAKQAKIDSTLYQSDTSTPHTYLKFMWIGDEELNIVVENNVARSGKYVYRGLPEDLIMSVDDFADMLVYGDYTDDVYISMYWLTPDGKFINIQWFSEGYPADIGRISQDDYYDFVAHICNGGTVEGYLDAYNELREDE